MLNRSLRSFAWLFVAVLIAAAGCHPTPKPHSAKPPAAVSSKPAPDGIRFEDVAERAGITYVYPQQPKPMRNLEAFGCGCAAFDFDDDGWMDILLVTKPHPILYHNRGNGTFEDVTAGSGLDKLSGDWKGVAIGDYDNDGRLDIVLTGYRCLALMKNTDGHHFRDVTREAGLDPTNRNHWGSSAGFMDLDGSGRLALVILNYVIFNAREPQYCELVPGVMSGCPPSTYKPEYGELWRNDDSRSYRDVTHVSGMKASNGKALVIAFCDVNNDGKIDFFVGNDGTPADLMLNKGNLRFINVGESSGTNLAVSGRAMAAMGADWADYDGDGRQDLVVSGFSDEVYALYHYVGGVTFEHRENETELAGPTLKPLGFGTKWLDFENDGRPDICFANGHVYDNVERIDPLSSYRQPIMLFHNEKSRSAVRFVDLAPSMGPDVARPIVGRGSATLDFDNDGRVDIVIVDYEGRPLLLRNTTDVRNHWITLDARQARGNRFAYGARVTLMANGKVWVSQVSPASSYCSSSDPRIHFGLGTITRIDRAEIRWSDGKTQSLRGLMVDHVNRVVRTEPGATQVKAQPIPPLQGR